MAVGLFVGTSAWAATEKATKQGTSDAAINGTCYSIDGTFVAGPGNTKKGSMQNEGVKFRTGKSSNTIVFTVKSGYYITNFKFYCVENGTTGEEKINGVYIDDDTSTNKLASTINVPKNNGSTSADINISGITAAKKITIQFNDAGKQINGYYELTYQNQTKLSTPDITFDDKTVTIGAVANATKVTYTTDGTTPTASSTTYAGPFEVAYGATVKAIAIANGTTHTNSNVASQFVPIPNEWDFTESSVWGSITLPTAESNTKNYQYNGVGGTTGNYVTFYSTEAKIVHPSTLTNGIGFSATGSTSDNYVKISVPAGYTATVTANCTSNRNLKVTFNGVVSPAFTDVVQYQEFANTTEGSLDLYIYCTQNAGGASKQPWLKKIELKQTFQVTTNYVDEESKVIKNATVENVLAGSTYSTTYDATYYVSNTDPFTYTYVSGAASGVTINAAAEYTLVYHKGDRPSYKLNVTQSYGGSSQKIVDDQTVYEGASYTYYYPRFIKVGTTLYEYASSTDPEASDTYWYSTISSMAANKDYTLTYNAKDGVCVYYSEGENVANKSGAYTYANWRNGMSNGSSGVFGSDTKLITLGAGNYTVTARVNGRASDRYVDIAKTSNTEENRIIHAVSANYGKESSADFSLTGSTDIVVNGGYVSSENGHGLDYVYIMKTAESATITSAGWATFCSAYDLDFTTPIEGLTVYKAASATKDAITLEEVNGKVKAGDGLVLKGDEDTYSIPVTTDATTIYDTPETITMWGNTGSTNQKVSAATGSGTNFVLASQGGKVVFAPVKTTSATLAPSQAALWADVTISEARSLNIVFGDEATAISAVQNSKEKSDEVYNLAGQRVAQPAKGLYIVNGKKVIMK